MSSSCLLHDIQNLVVVKKTMTVFAAITGQTIVWDKKGGRTARIERRMV